MPTKAHGQSGGQQTSKPTGLSPGAVRLPKRQSAIDMARQATTEAQLERTKGRSYAWALGDIKSAFNYTQKANVLARLEILDKLLENNKRYIHWFYQPWTAELTWDGETRKTTTIKSGVPQGSPASPVLFLIGVAKAFENADTRIVREINSHKVKIYSYVDDFNCTIEQIPTSRPGRRPEAITAARKARYIVSEELENLGWSRDPDKDEEINFGIQGEAKWVGIHFTHDLQWKTHCSKRTNSVETGLHRQHVGHHYLRVGTWAYRASHGKAQKTAIQSSTENNWSLPRSQTGDPRNHSQGGTGPNQSLGYASEGGRQNTGERSAGRLDNQGQKNSGS